MKARRFKKILMGIGVLALFSTAVMGLWNVLIPEIFGLATLNFWQALGLFVLARILFSGLGGGRMMMWGMMGHHAMHHVREHNQFREKWMNMTDDERREFIRKRKAFGFGGPFGGGDHFGRSGFDRNNGGEEFEKENE